MTRPAGTAAGTEAGPTTAGAAISPLHGLPLEALERRFLRCGLPEHQARLVFQALHGGRNVALTGEAPVAPSSIPGISRAARKYLEANAPLPRLSIDGVHRAQDGTLKFRLRTTAGDSIEAVLIPAPSGRRVTLCVSSQVGCAAGCGFCHTASMGLLRNLAPWEIVEQYRVAREYWSLEGDHGAPDISNVVFMGMGEPLHNEENVAQACRILGDDRGAGISRRRLVVSTAGVGNRIRAFWERGVAVLALSLHAASNDVRDRLTPLNTQWNVETLREILLSIPWRPRESVTIAYLLLDGVNDSLEDARRLAEWTRGLPAKVNLLEFNPYPGSQYRRAAPEKLAAFRQWLYELGVFNTLRHSRGGDVMAACGQLAVGK